MGGREGQATLFHPITSRGFGFTCHQPRWRCWSPGSQKFELRGQPYHEAVYDEGQRRDILPLTPDELGETETMTMTRRISRDEATVALELTQLTVLVEIGVPGVSQRCLSSAQPRSIELGDLPSFIIPRHLTTFHSAIVLVTSLTINPILIDDNP